MKRPALDIYGCLRGGADLWFSASTGCPVEGHWFLVVTSDGKNLIASPKSSYDECRKYFESINALWWSYLPAPPKIRPENYPIRNGRKYVFLKEDPFNRHQGWEIAP